MNITKKLKKNRGPTIGFLLGATIVFLWMRLTANSLSGLPVFIYVLIIGCTTLTGFLLDAFLLKYKTSPSIRGSRKGAVLGALWGLVGWAKILFLGSGRTIHEFEGSITIKLFVLPSYIPYNIAMLVGHIPFIGPSISVLILVLSIIPIFPILIGSLLGYLIIDITLERKVLKWHE